MLSLTIAVSRLLAARRDSAMREAVLGAIRSHLADPLNGLAACRSSSFADLRTIQELQLPPASSWSTLYAGPSAEVLLLPRPTVNLSGWTSYLDSDLGEDEAAKQVVRLQPGEDLLLLMEADESADVEAFIRAHQQWWSDQEHAVKLESLCRRVAWRTGPPFAVVLACSLLDLERLIEAYLSDLLITDDPLSINQILVVQARGRPAQLIRTTSASSFGDRPVSLTSSPAPRRHPGPPGKPPNVVLFDAGSTDRSRAVMTALRSALDPDSYVLHALTAKDWHSGTWRRCTALLLCLCDAGRGLAEVRAEAVEFAADCGGHVILLLREEEEMAENELENFEEGWTEVEGKGGRVLCLRDLAGLTEPSRLHALLAALEFRLRDESAGLEESDCRPLLVSSAGDDTQACLQEVLSAFSSSRLLLLDTKNPPTEGRRSLIAWEPHSDLRNLSTFRFEVFRQGLKDCPVPITLVHADVLTSSWSIMEGIFARLKPNSGLTLSSFRQTEAKGRGQNAWISPPGQLQVTFHASAHVSSHLGQHPTLIQHVAAVSVILAIEDALPEKKDVGLRIKWPNDIYWRRSEDQLVKLGGFLSKASMMGLDFHFIIGLGLNVSNAKPTACLHQVLLDNGISAKSLPSIEALMRNILLRFFCLKTDLEQGRMDLDAFRTLYTSHWLHTGQKVSVTQPNGSQLSDCRVLGLDGFGYLFVQCRTTGERFSIQPDGNSFDMMANLIKPK